MIYITGKRSIPQGKADYQIFLSPEPKKTIGKNDEKNVENLYGVAGRGREGQG